MNQLLEEKALDLVSKPGVYQLGLSGILFLFSFFRYHTCNYCVKFRMSYDYI